MQAPRSTRSPWTRRALPAFMAALALAPVASLAGQEGPLEGFADHVAAAVATWDAPGLAVAVVKDGELVFARGYGVRTLGEEGAVDAETRFSIGSTTKAMTAAALGMLVEEGAVEWDDRVIDHLPWFRLKDPYLTREITLRDLLTHRAGLGNADFLWYEQEVAPEEVLHRIRYADLAYSPRSSFIYQNVMYATAGAVVAAVSGKSWQEFVRSRIFRPVGMTGAVTSLAATRTLANVATPHYRIDGVTQPIENASVDPVDAAGSVWAGVADMSIWLRTLLAEGVAPNGTRILEESTVEELFTPQTLVPPDQFYPTQQVTEPSWMTYGLGWFQHDYQGRKVDFHTGSIDGMVAIAGLIRDLELGVYVLANRDHVELRHALMYDVFDRYLGTESRDWSEVLFELYEGATATPPSAEQPTGSPLRGNEAYVGTYSDELYGSVEISERGGGLWLRYGPGLQGPLTPRGGDSFTVRYEARWRGQGSAVFVPSGSGEVASLRYRGATFARESP